MPSGPARPEVAADSGHDGRFVRAPGVLWRQVADAVLVRTVPDAAIVELRGTGVLLWLALEEPVTAGELAAELAAVVGAPLDDVAGDVGPALSELVSRRLVARLEPA